MRGILFCCGWCVAAFMEVQISEQEPKELTWLNLTKNRRAGRQACFIDVLGGNQLFHCLSEAQ